MRIVTILVEVLQPDGSVVPQPVQAKLARRPTKRELRKRAARAAKRER